MTHKRRLPAGAMTKKTFDDCIIAAEKSCEDDVLVPTKDMEEETPCQNCTLSIGNGGDCITPCRSIMNIKKACPAYRPKKSREDRAEEAYERGDWTEAQKIMRGSANASTDDKHE